MRFMQIKFKNNWIPNFIVLYFKNIGSSLIRLPLQAPAQDCEVVVSKVIGCLCFSLCCRSFRNRMWEQTPKGISWKKQVKLSLFFILSTVSGVFFQRHLRVSLYRAMSCKPPESLCIVFSRATCSLVAPLNHHLHVTLSRSVGKLPVQVRS